MDIDVFSDHQMPLVLRVLRTALRPVGQLDARERLFLDTYAYICDFERDPADPPAVEPEAVTIADGHQRKRLVQLSAMAVLHALPVRPSAFNFLKALARRLDAHDPVIDAIAAALRGHKLAARVLTMRRGFRVFLKEAYYSEGAWGVARFLGAMLLKATVNKERMWNYKRLGLLPEGTLGREFFKHMATVGFAFPGEPKGIPDSIAYHDVIHVLAEHPTTPLGEIQQACFQAGNRREDGFFFAQMVLLHFHQGVYVTPATPATTGMFEPDKVLWAIYRGSKCNVDMTHGWDFWPLMQLPMAEARRQVALLPRLGAAGAWDGAADPGYQLTPMSQPLLLKSAFAAT
jgi:hypothetical protein